MALPADQQQKIDFRVYIGILFFHWQTIVVCFLYCILGAVLYIHFVPKQYRTRCNLMLYRDPRMAVTQDQTIWKSQAMHSYVLTSKKLRDRVIERLLPEWGEKMGSYKRMLLHVEVGRRTGIAMFEVSAKSYDPGYGQAFMATLLEEHMKEWENIQNEAAESAARMLENELVNLQEKIREAEDDIIEYERLHDVTREAKRGASEVAYLSELISRRRSLQTELQILETQYPLLKDANASVINAVKELSAATGSIEPQEVPDKGAASADAASPQLPPALMAEKTIRDATEETPEWLNLTVKLKRLEQRKKDLEANLKPEHPSIRSVQKDIDDIKNRLEVAAQIEFEKLQDRHKALSTHLKAIEALEYQWVSKSMMASKRKAELNRLLVVRNRYENNYNTLYARLHDMRVDEELKSEHYRVVEPVTTSPRPVWPDPTKVLLVAVALGLGSGLGIALLAQTFDNKLQSIGDVEKVLGIPFLGGIPFWVHSGLEKATRPIVTEENSTGAVEAYRALRTTVVSSLKKAGEKVAFFTSADSREGKTLTTLNTSIMVAQMNKKVLLVDMDLRRGRLHRSLGMEKAPGVTDALKEGKSLREFVRKTRIENLDLVPTGSTVDDAAELLQSRGIGALLGDVQDDYDYIFIDTSPVLRVTDTVIVATQGLGVVLYVARVNRTPKPLIRYSLDMLKDARIIGLIMNSIEMHKISSLYYTYQYPNYAYYSNAYSYGYDHYYTGDDSTSRRGRRRRGPVATRLRDAGQWLRRTFLPMD